MNPTIRQFLFLGALTLGLTACPEVMRTPLVLTIDPADGAAEVPVDVTIRAELSLPDGQVDVSTLTDETVTLTDASGTPVEAGRMMVGSVLEVDPAAELEPGSAYTFTVTSALQTENGVPVTGASSTFTTALDGNNGNPDGELSADRERVVFSAGGASSNDLRTLTLTNIGGETIDVSSLSISGDDDAQFSLAESAFSLAPGEARTLELTFTPSGLGPQLATLVVTSSSSPTLNIPLGGLGVAGQGGELEPSLQWIFDTYGLPIDSGDDDASSTPLVDRKVNGFVGDEVSGQTFTKASATEPVTVEVLATFGVENDPVLEFGTYTAGNAGARTELFTVEQTPGLNEQRLAPELNLTGGTGAGDSVTFDPGAGAFGFYSYWPTNRFFGERTVYTEDALNTFSDAIPHQVRAYPLVNADGSTEANAYVLATEEFSRGFDYNDVVFIVRNVTPGTGATPPGGSVAGLEFTTPVGLPYSDRLVLHHINNTTGNLCDPTVDLTCDPNAEQWAEIVFRNTGVVRLENTGGGALQLSLSVTGSSGFVLPNGETSVTLPPGDSFDLTVQFAGDLGDKKGVFPGTLDVQAGAESAGFDLMGIYMPKPEGGREVYLEGVVNEAFGYQTDLGTNSQGGLTSASPDAPLAGDEVRAALWRAADSASPVVATQLAAFHSCCRTGEPFELWAQGASGPSARMRHDRVYSQTIYPSLPGESGAAQLSAEVDGPFEIRVAEYSTDPSKGKGAGNLGVRLWPLKDATGRAVADTYIVAQDFVEKGCGTSEVANCDYNDSLFVVSNIAPAN